MENLTAVTAWNDVSNEVFDPEDSVLIEPLITTESQLEKNAGYRRASIFVFWFWGILFAMYSRFVINITIIAISTGGCIAFGVTPIIIRYLTWPYAYYICGGTCLIWCIFWTVSGKKSPTADEDISWVNVSPQEIALIQSSKIPPLPPFFSIP